jgi:cysteine-rich repeat protein
MRTLSKSLLSLLCLFGVACEEPIDLGERGTPSGGSSSQPSTKAQPAMGGSSARSDTKLASRCGDGLLDSSEACDDGNTQAGDGCSPICRLEANVSRCGDGLLNSGEACDDGNAQAGDGCTADCRELEASFICPLPGAPCQLSPAYANCGNAVVDGVESCDDGNRAEGDGCSSLCQIVAGWDCRSAPRSVCAQICGDGVVTPGEECDLGSGNGVSGSECGLDCRMLAHCGDGVVSPGEECDLGSGNGVSGSGCGVDCRMLAHCGDGVVSPGEECDSGIGNGTKYGECAPNCQLGPHCGDGIVNGQEQCDDSVNDGLSGCQPNCTVSGRAGSAG